jgi:hypothetical protein
MPRQTQASSLLWLQHASASNRFAAYHSQRCAHIPSKRRRDAIVSSAPGKISNGAVCRFL